MIFKIQVHLAQYLCVSWPGGIVSEHHRSGFGLPSLGDTPGKTPAGALQWFVIGIECSNQRLTQDFACCLHISMGYAAYVGPF